MCGIVGYVGHNENVLHVLIDGLKKLEYRGYDSAGLAYVKNKKVIVKKEIGRVSNLEKVIDYSIKTNIGIAHTRWATHGKVTKTNSHPHVQGDIVLVHNGIIENYLELKEDLKLKGYKFISQTDTEVLAAFIDYYMKKNKEDIFKIIKEKIIGSYAIIFINKEEPEKLYVTKKDSPLLIGKEEDGFKIASDIVALNSNKYYLLDNYDYAIITKDNIKFNKEKELLSNDNKISDTSLGNFKHYMLKEIYEEKEVVKNIIDYYLKDKSLFEKRVLDLSKYKKIDIVACGSAYHAGMIGKYILEENKDIAIDVASEYRYRKTLISKDTLLILISQSGETADTLACLNKASDIDTLGIVNVETSRLARETKYQMFLKCGVEVAVATTKAYFSQVLMMKLLKYRLDNKYKEALEYFNKLLTDLPKSLEFNNFEIVDLISKQKRVFFIGRLIDYAISLEASLKLKEISYINAESYPAGELKHGTISLIEKNTVVIAISTDEEMALKTNSNLIEVKARGAITVAIVKKNLKKLINADYYIETPEDIDLLSIISIQLLSYYVADKLKKEIDKPRNLAKSVTVE
jgi:glucosamine--fructose-6-phosphate aminotransferase (isomerizing)